MATALTVIDPIQIPDLRKPTAKLLCPAWLASQRATLKENLQVTDQGFRDVLTLPQDRMPTPLQREVLHTTIRNLNSFLDQTPESGAEWAAETLATMTKMLLVLGGHKATELAGEAKAEAFMEALEDIPSWAVVAASRRWYRGDCGNDPGGHPYDYRFVPDPATMRRLATRESFRAKLEIAEMQKVLGAVLYIDCTKALERGRAAMAGFWQTWGKGKGSGLKDLTFEQAIDLGSGQLLEPPALPKP